MHRHLRHLLAVLAVGAITVTGLVLTDSAQAASRVMPGSFTGYAFDACQAPTQEQMDVWRETSPYFAVGIYTSGVNRLCDEQVNLSADWVFEQSRLGWRLLPIHVGLQASCASYEHRISADPTDSYATARAQGRAEAKQATDAARSYGIAKGSTLWYDLENFDIRNTRCRASALALVSAWTRRLHDLGYRSGLYSSASSGITMVEQARTSRSTATLPDRIWIAHHSGEQSTSTRYISDDGWKRNRVRQYNDSHVERYGGVALEIDSNFMDVGAGSVPPKAAPHCGVQVDFGTYPRRALGSKGSYVAAGQCLLRKQRFYDGKVHGRFTPATRSAVVRLQRSAGVPVTGVLDRRTWTALTARGIRPLLKYGSRHDAVRRLQRSLNAADAARIPVTGVFEGRTRRAVRTYQADHGLPTTGVVTVDLWNLLQRGRP